MDQHSVRVVCVQVGRAGLAGGGSANPTAREGALSAVDKRRIEVQTLGTLTHTKLPSEGPVGITS